ncbi:protoporphyrinogen oxidase [Lacticigenium naphthae]|uniref:protoporphyrinogen oxidase n=1 Tax=Lacticigenium naphthae TaxID=515351 RepID=UPI00040DFA65|nr:protoporphyrinogen oxidase [Lacticigenium naphthae]
MKRSKKRIAIIGSGITGLTTAYRIKKIIERDNLPIELVIFEASIRSGGKIFTMKQDDLYLDMGAESIDIRMPQALELIKELGLLPNIEKSKNGKPDIFFYNQLYSADFPTYKGIPVYSKDIWKYSILSFQGKLAFLKNIHKKQSRLKKDIQISEYLRKRIGSEMAEHVVEPFFSKIYASSVDEMGIKASREQIFEVEKANVKLPKGLVESSHLWDGKGNYVTFNEGLEVLTQKLVEELKPYIRYNKTVTEIKPNKEGTYILDINHKQQVRVGSVCVATDPKAYGEIFDDEVLSAEFSKMKLGSIGYVLFSFPKNSIQQKPKGFGIVAPRRNDSFVTSAVWLNKKWEFLHSHAEELVGVSFGRVEEEFIMSLSNNQLEESILADIKKMFGIKDDPNFRIIKRWPHSIPQYQVDHELRVEAIEARLRYQYPGVFIAGNGFKGFGINPCIEQANKVSMDMIEHIKKQNSIF